MRLFNRTRRVLVKLDDFREERIDTFIAESILANLDENTKVDELEEKAIIAGITAASAYASTYGLPACPEKVKKAIAQEAVYYLGKANKRLRKRLNEKSKAYTRRHQNADVL